MAATGSQIGLELGALAASVVAAVSANPAASVATIPVPEEEFMQSRIRMFSEIQQKIAQLRSDLAASPSLAREFKSEPMKVMTERGISVDAQFEILGEEKLIDGIEVACYGTCACSGCCNTSSNFEESETMA